MDSNIQRVPSSWTLNKNPNSITSQKENNDSLSVSSMNTLIFWNINKAVEKNPGIELRTALKTAQERLEVNAHDVKAIISQYPEERHLACALLAWQQLGHSSAESLWRFVLEKRGAPSGSTLVSKDMSLLDKIDIPLSSIDYVTPEKSKCYDTNSIGPVIKLPLDTKIIMRLDATSSGNRSRRSRTPEKNIMDKISKACCLDKNCATRLEALDNQMLELRARAVKLAKHEQERMRLLERAEAAWKDLELSYQRRLTLAEEKEDEFANRTKKLIEERNSYKAACVALANKLKGVAEDADKERANLTKLEKDVCMKACTRLGLMEDAIREDSILSDNQCKAAQLDRDLQFKEEQARRKLQSLQSEMDSTRTLTFEAERAMRAELTALREQITEVSKQLLTDDADNSVILKELEELRQKKMDIVEDLNGCKAMCDDKMQVIINQAKEKRAELEELQNKIMDCKCKIPIDESVEAKRTPSLAAICQCAPEDRMIEPCSCTSLRSSLLSTMLCDLFGGLQSELGDTGAAMPCQLLKCLEDKHKWDRASAVTTNLRNFFSKLLIEELDIAIANSIEKYHAKWVGASCADDMKELIDPNKTEGWQKRAIEREAQKLATELADKMFEEKAKQLAERAKAIASENEPPPCECGPPKPNQALYSVMVEPPTFTEVAGVSPSHSRWKNTANDVTMLRVEIENLKKEAIKREDLKIMEHEIAKIIQLTSTSDCNLLIENKEVKNKKEGTNNKNRPAKCPLKSNNTNNICNKAPVSKRKQVEVNNRSKNDKNSMSIQGTKQFKRPGQSYAVNICLCGSKIPKKLTSKEKTVKKSLLEVDEKLSLKKQPLKDLVSQVSSIRQTKPIANVPTEDSVTKKEPDDSCKSNCACFHKIPSNSSIDNLLKTIEKWQSEMETINKLAKNVSTKQHHSDNDTSITEVDTIIRQIVREDTTLLSNMSDEAKPDSYFTKSHPKENDIIIFQPENDVLEGKPLDIEKLIKDGETVYPTVTESEYMGAINLDKSNENFCKCIVDCDKEEIFPLKCMRACSCPLKILDSKTNSMKNNSNEIENHQLPVAKHQPIQVKHAGLGSNNIVKSSLSKNIFMKNNVPLNIFTDVNNLVNRGVQMAYSLNSVEKDEAKNLPVFSNNITKTAFPDYDIEFLGVTLTDTVTKYNNENVNKKGKLSKVEYCSRTEPEKDSKNYIENYADADQSKNIGIDNPEFLESPNCKCQSDLKDIKNLFSSMLTAQRGTTYDNEDKCLDTQSLKDYDKKDSCVCCPKNEKDVDLELNTFILLEEHLKRKLYELKLNCTALCYPADEEEKVLSKLIEKIRELVICSTNEVMCKCSETKEIDGSWNRALNLLQEYLNTKINRVQCLCSSPRNSNKLLVPDVMDKVCNLIDNDFTRLKQICKCKNMSRASSRKKSSEQVTFQLPEKETSFVKNEIIVNDYLLDTTNSDDDYSDIQFRLDQNVSSQVSPYIGMSNKSCITSQNDIMYTEPLLIGEINTNKATKEIKSDSCECRSGCFGNKSEAFTKNFRVAKKVLVNQCSDILKDDNNDVDVKKISIDTRKEEIIKKNTDIPLVKDESAPKNDVVDQISPYIGYTVDCTCGSNNLNNCVCSKSIVKKNNSTIDKIWKSVISKPIKQNTSYIMKSLKKCDELNVVKLKEDSIISLPNESISFCDLNTSAHNMDSEIVLKNSAEYQNRTLKDDSTNTAGVHSPPFNTYDNNSSEVYELAAQTTNSTVNIDEKALKSELFLHNHERLLTRSLSQYCKCSKVPICHVKMLMDNIEDKLLKSGCTCDSLNIKVCPVHSFKKN